MNKLTIVAFLAVAVMATQAAPQLRWPTMQMCTVGQILAKTCTTTAAPTTKKATTKATTTTTTTTTTQPPPAAEEPAQEEAEQPEEQEEQPTEEQPAEGPKLNVVPLGSLMFPGMFGGQAAAPAPAPAPAEGDGQAKLEVIPLYEWLNRQG